MKFTNTKYGLDLHISDHLFDQISKFAIANFPNEYGGFLFGKYSDDMKSLYIESILVPEKYCANRFSFERSLDGIEKEFTNIFNDKKIYYVGEWHTHPNGESMFSNMDLLTMKAIAECDAVRIVNPILYILGVNMQHQVSSTFYLYNNFELKPYAKNID